MALPDTGTTPAAGGYLDTDNRVQGGHRTGLIAAFYRDARGALTNISPHAANGDLAWSPFALDGKLRGDLRAVHRVDGSWVPVETTNEGWYGSGAFAQGDGPSTKQKLTVDTQRIEQTIDPFESEITERESPFTISILQNLLPWNQRLLNDLPLVNSEGVSLVERVGAPNYGIGQPLEPGDVLRQFLLYGIRKRGGMYLYEVDTYDCVRRTDLGEYKLGRKGTAPTATFTPEDSGFFMAKIDGEVKPVIKYTHIGGPAWGALYTSPVSQYLVTLGTQATGTFTLGLVGGSLSATIAYGATNSAVKSAVVAIDDGYGASDWAVSGSNGGPYTVTVPAGRQLTGDGSSLETPGTFVITPITS